MKDIPSVFSGREAEQVKERLRKSQAQRSDKHEIRAPIAGSKEDNSGGIRNSADDKAERIMSAKNPGKSPVHRDPLRRAKQILGGDLPDSERKEE